MTVLRARIVGLEQLERNINDLAEEFGPRNARTAYNRALNEALTPIEDEIRNTTPVDTGDTQRLTRRRVRAPRRNEIRGPHINQNAVVVGEAGWFYRRGESSSHALLAIEYGTSRQSGRRVLRGAFGRRSPEALRVFSRTLGDSITRTATRLGRRRARQGSGFRRR